jgi:sialic acid synthase SpsE|tara:strand:+ start:792 stop:1853 length:1062 start_codon:yes stop_codon:yes gene_type:complete
MIIKGKKIGLNKPTFFIADIAANHDGDLNKAIDLIHLSAECGADAAKFQHFKAETIVSDIGFKKLKEKKSHQSSWKKSVYEVYKDASINLEWTEKLKKECDKCGIIFFTSPYDLELVDHVDKYVPAYKIGSGDITYLEIINKIASKKKPVILATGASTLKDVDRAVKNILAKNKELCLMQCNTNYTAEKNNLNFINLNVLKTYKKRYPNVLLGLSDHTAGHSSVLGAITLGARMVEKHFTNDNFREGPDHKFSMNANSWKEMILRSRELEQSLGVHEKKIEKNESQTVIVQRRAIRAKINILKGQKISKSDIISLRPCPKNSIEPFEQKKILGKKIKKNITKGDLIKWEDLKL